MDNHDKKYTLLVRGTRVTVAKEVYKAYYHCRDREKYLDKLAEYNNISLEGCNEKGISVGYIISTAEDSMEDEIVQRDMVTRLEQCLLQLDEAERQLIIALFYLEKSEHQLAAETGIPRMTLHDRKVRALGKLKKLLEIKKFSVQPLTFFPKEVRGFFLFPYCSLKISYPAAQIHELSSRVKSGSDVDGRAKTACG
ncbi:sigma factor-like helix-turn-helix DNA-binding protein [Desulfosporosinus sp. BICA1-9]|uniref:sigma factor-like helix-turn-helix DNA-binding protein n=1 Tax=Desulfosporosinus sp. BICA1-9 TaxID=1531958 RepID=UPI000E9C077F|nr:sigma factor-like helix-turn-helix DNA-binding protein [Desulfosporosinus sp. BICA1-9]HBW37379.1 DNA-directed RNA polymerase subunit beta [Desulfosporosinus sp.]